MELVNEVLHKYCESHSKVFNEDVLLEIDRFTNLNVLMPQMLSGYLQGQYLAMMSKMIQPKNILEIGTFTGYSAICLAQGLQDEGHLYTLEANEELKAPVTDFFKKAGLEEKISMQIGNGVELIDKFDIIFDLIFIDADKSNYSLYFDLKILKIILK